MVFRALEEITNFSGSAEDVLELIGEKVGTVFESRYAAGPIRALHRIAEQSEE